MRKAIDDSALDARPRSSDEEVASLARYIAEMSAELAQLAERCELTMLAYFLNLSRVEAEFRSRELIAPARYAARPPKRRSEPTSEIFRATKRD